MDPQACFLALITAQINCTEDYNDYLDDLRTWLRSGGFAPTVKHEATETPVVLLDVSPTGTCMVQGLGELDEAFTCRLRDLGEWEPQDDDGKGGPGAPMFELDGTTYEHPRSESGSGAWDDAMAESTEPVTRKAPQANVMRPVAVPPQSVDVFTYGQRAIEAALRTLDAYHVTQVGVTLPDSSDGRSVVVHDASPGSALVRGELMVVVAMNSPLGELAQELWAACRHGLDEVCAEVQLADYVRHVGRVRGPRCGRVANLNGGVATVRWSDGSLSKDGLDVLTKCASSFNFYREVTR